MNWTTALASSLLAATVAACATPVAEQQATKEGLTAVHSSKLDEVYIRPNMDPRRYGQVLIEAVPVELRDDYISQRHAYNRIQPIYPRYEDAERLVQFVTASVEASLAEAFKARGYQVVSAPEPGALRISAKVTELFVNAPDRLMPWITRNFTRDAGQATLTLEARDMDGTLVALIRHRLIARELSRINVADDVSNRMWLDTAFRRWAANAASELAGQHRTQLSLETHQAAP